MTLLRRCLLSALLSTLPGAAVAQAPEAPPIPRVAILGGVGNDLGWFGAQGSVRVGSRVAVFAGLGYTVGAGYVLSAPTTGSRFQPAVGLGLGHAMH